jgi:outer membrane protein TolC
MRNFLGLIILLLVAPFVFSQRSKETLSFDNYLKIVKAHHPVMQQAGLIPQVAEATLLKAKGGFDPKLFADVSQKYFEGDQYYSIINTGVSIPTWFGLNFYSGYDQTEGTYLSSQLRTPDNGLVYAGVQWTLGQGLLIDQRRADLKQARIFTQMAEQERVMLVNQLLLDASVAYWEWYAAYNSLDFVEEAYQFTETRFQALRQSAIIGEKAFLDTLEMHIQLQNLDILRQSLILEEMNSRIQCGLFLWADGTVPVELNDNAAPSEEMDEKLTNEMSSLAIQFRSMIDSHPELVNTMLKINQQEIELRLKQEMLRPVVNLKYNALNEPIGSNLITNYAIQNYTWGLDFSIPILLRKERAGVQLSKLKLQDLSFSLDNKRQLLVMKAQASINEWQLVTKQLELYERNLKDIQRLLDAERQLFDLGESSVFLVNTREMVLVRAQIKYFEFLSKSQKALFKSYYSLALMESI